MNGKKKLSCLAASAALIAAGAATPRPAAACGGLFCGQAAPVVQTGEGIIFTVDPQNQQVQAVINIRYQGAANDFAWVLPLQSAPARIGVAPTFVFQMVDQLTAPRFQLTVERSGICSEEVELGGSDEAAFVRSPEPEGVQVLSREAVGPYETAVIASSDSNEIRTWLTNNGYNVTDEMMMSVTPYVAQGDVLLALKLRKDRDTGDIQPISLDIESVEACVPIRMTAIAAQADMDITAVVLSNEGRAIPDNYFHVTLNLARIDWMTRGTNYRQVVADAADEGEGNAFTTEFAGPASIFANRIDLTNRVSRESLAFAGDQRAFLEALQPLAGISELAGVFMRYLSPNVLNQPGMTIASLVRCPACSSVRFQGLPIDATAAADDVWTNIVEPSQRAQEMFDRFSYVTRLYTLISPEEMTIDPIFSFKPGLGDVSNIHTARLRLDCGIGGSGNNANATLIIDELGAEIELDSVTPGETDRSVLDQMPGSVVVEQLRDGTVVQNNVALISQMIAEHNSGVLLGCGCSSAKARRNATALSAVMFIGLAIAARVSRKRR